jgi:putative addiction module killer protein
MKDNIDIQLYETENGKCPYLQWEDRLSKSARAIITTRLARIRLGNLGDCKSIQGVKGIYEFRIHIESGYRIYFGKEGNKVILLLLGGDKSTQKKNVQKAQEFWQDYLESNKGE